MMARKKKPETPDFAAAMPLDDPELTTVMRDLRQDRKSPATPVTTQPRRRFPKPGIKPPKTPARPLYNIYWGYSIDSSSHNM
jgi:hypothetical protein